MDLHPGQMLGPYRIDERLVSGGMAKVYRALQSSTGREVAIKVLPALQADAAAVARFAREMRVLAGLQHPHILGLIDAGEDGPWHYLVLPLVRRGDLADLIAREDGPLPLSLARRVALQLCDALDYAHAQGVIHRDLKPANVLLDDGGNCLLTDFGIALPDGAERLTAVGRAIGTPESLAPEQAEGRADARSDLYALGLIVFQLITGRMPFDAHGSAAWLQAHRETPVPAPRAFNPALPPALDAVVLKALAKRPEERYQSAAEFAAALRAALPEAVYAEGALPMPDAATRLLPALPPRRSGKTRRIAIVIAAVAAVGALVTWRVWPGPAEGRSAGKSIPKPAIPAQDSAAARVSSPVDARPEPAPVSSSSSAPAPATDASITALAATPSAPPPASGSSASASDAAYDNFDDTRFDGRFDPARWQLTRTGAQMHFEQGEDSLHVHSQEHEHGLYAEFRGTQLLHVSASLRLDEPLRAAQSSVGISLSRRERPDQWVSCYVFAALNAGRATPVCTDQRRTQFPSGGSAALGEWHDVDLQVDAAAQRIVVAADGQAIGELPFPGPAGTADWYLLISGWSSDGQPVEGDVASVRVEHRP